MSIEEESALISLNEEGGGGVISNGSSYDIIWDEAHGWGFSSGGNGSVSIGSHLGLDALILDGGEPYDAANISFIGGVLIPFPNSDTITLSSKCNFNGIGPDGTGSEFLLFTRPKDNFLTVIHLYSDACYYDSGSGLVKFSNHGTGPFGADTNVTFVWRKMTTGTKVLDFYIDDNIIGLDLPAVYSSSGSKGQTFIQQFGAYNDIPYTHPITYLRNLKAGDGLA